MPIYSSPGYGMGLDVQADANAPVTKAQAAKARAELARMKRSLTQWLHYRQLNDQGVTAQVRASLQRWRSADETIMARQLHQLLSEAWGADRLPSPDLALNPGAAAALAQIAISGKLPGEAATPAATGFVWLWPIVAVVGAIAIVLTTMIRSNADVAKEREKLECIKAGKCTDSGFWLKIGGVAVVGWLVWDKAGLRERVTGALGKKSATRGR